MVESTSCFCRDLKSVPNTHWAAQDYVKVKFQWILYSLPANIGTRHTHTCRQKKKKRRNQVWAHICSPSTQEAEAGTFGAAWGTVRQVSHSAPVLGLL